MTSSSNAAPLDLAFFDRIAQASYAKYSSLPKSGKPNSSEWTLMSAVVQSNGGSLKVVSLGTGSKCVGRNEMSRTGDVLNDSHAEVIARRGFLRYLYEKVEEMRCRGVSDVFESIHEGKCSLREDVEFHFFTSHTPCGDASIFPKTSLHLAHFTDECLQVEDTCDSTKLDGQISGVCGTKKSEIDVTLVNRKRASGEEMVVLPAKCFKSSSEDERDHSENEDTHRTGAKCVETAVQDSRSAGLDYHVLGVLRTKPGRGDPTLSLSCSDKLARWNVMGCQGALLSLLIAAPLIFRSIVVGGGGPFSSTALRRAIVDRIAALQTTAPFIVQSSLSFSDRRTADASRRLCASSIVWCDVGNRPLEISVKGRKQGVTKKALETSSGRLMICRKELGRQFIAASGRARLDDLTYRQIKDMAQDYGSQWLKVKEAIFQTWPAKPLGFMEFRIYD